MIAQERSPRLRRRPPMADRVLGNDRLGDLEPELGQFTVDARCIPEPVLPARPPNDLAQVATDPRTSPLSVRLPTPVGSKPSSMRKTVSGRTTRDRLSSSGQSRVIQTMNARSDPRRRKRVRSLPHRDIELMSQIQVLDLKSAPRLEPPKGKNKEQVKQGKHRCRAMCRFHLTLPSPARIESSGGTG